MNQDQSYGTGVALVIMATAGWSLSGLFVRLLPGLTGWQINCWRGLFMSLSLLAYLAWRYRWGLVDIVRGIPPLALVSVAGFFALGSTLYVTALTLTSTANVSCLAATAPLFTALLSRPLNGERVTPATWAAALLALVGVAVVMREGLETGNLAGNLMALGCAFSFAFQVNALRRFRSFDMVPAVLLGGLVIFVLGGLAGGFSVTGREMAIIAVMGPVQLGLPLVFFARASRSVPAVLMSLIALLDVVLNPLWAYLGVGETPTWSDAAGTAIVMTAVALSIALGRRLPTAPQARAGA